MAEFKPTAGQQAAIQNRGGAILVSAGAGSGKTKVITERLMSRICHPTAPVDVDSFLIITYTRAAAAELRSRIMEELGRRIAAQPDNRRLRRQSALCSKAQIGTIHSFCSAVLREYSHMTELTPDFKVIDDERAATMKNAALEQVLEQRYAQADPVFLRLADTLGSGRDDSRMVKLVLMIHEKMQCHARPHQWAEQQIRAMYQDYADAGETPWGQEILEQLGKVASYWSEEAERMLRQAAREKRIMDTYGEALQEDGAMLREIRRCTALGWERTRSCLPIEFPRLKILRNSPDPILSDRIKARRKKWKDAILASVSAVEVSSEDVLAQLKAMAPVMEALLRLTLDFDMAYKREKQRCGFVDYSDLEHFAAQLLTREDGSPTELAKSLSQRYTEIMVDEYQDVSRVQDTIFNAISREGRNLFFVGDVKQSIYRFRLADPTIFTEKYESYANHEQAAEGEPRRILLQENFRSRREILNCANAVFSLCMSRELGELDYDEDAALKYGAEYYEGSVPIPELMLLELAGEEAEEEEQTPDKVALEAAMVAEKIQSLIASETQVQGRSLRYEDICILMRSANTVGSIYRRELTARGIPVAAGESGDFFTSMEVSVMLSMLAVIDNPHQDIPLIAVLRSPAFGFDEEALSVIRARSSKGDFYEALCQAAEDHEACAAFLRLLKELRNTAPDLQAQELLWQLIHRLDMLALCAAMHDGELRRQRLMDLIELSAHFEATGYKGLHRFVLWLRQLAENKRSPAHGNDSERGVQIMTVHKSKGLEFPVVFLCDTARQFNKQDSREAVLIHPKLGLGPKVTDLEKRVEFPGVMHHAIRIRNNRELLSEEMRLLYVALTRPKERLIITGTVKNAEKKLEKCRAGLTVPMEAQVLTDVRAPLEWLIYAALADEGQHLSMKIYQADQGLPAESRPAAEGEEDAQSGGFDLSRLRYRYPHKEAEALPGKLTATELKGQREADEDCFDASPAQKHLFRSPRLTEEPSDASPRRRGIATHLALQYMDYAKTETMEELRTEIARLREERYLTAQDAALVDIPAILRLFASPLGKRIRQADQVHRELKFSLLVDADMFYPEAAGEQLLLQGVVDCCLEENGKLVIVDYKTDRVYTEGELRQRTEEYRQQLKIYALAMRRVFGREVSACLLYFLSAGKMLEIPEKDLQN